VVGRTSGSPDKRARTSCLRKFSSSNSLNNVQKKKKGAASCQLGFDRGIPGSIVGFSGSIVAIVGFDRRFIGFVRGFFGQNESVYDHHDRLWRI